MRAHTLRGEPQLLCCSFTSPNNREAATGPVCCNGSAPQQHKYQFGCHTTTICLPEYMCYYKQQVLPWHLLPACKDQHAYTYPDSGFKCHWSSPVHNASPSHTISTQIVRIPDIILMHALPGMVRAYNAQHGPASTQPSPWRRQQQQKQQQQQLLQAQPKPMYTTFSSQASPFSCHIPFRC